MKRIACYLRVSTDAQQTDSQKADIERWLAENAKGREVETFEDKLSGKSEARPQYQAMLKKAMRGAFDLIVVYRLDRFSRNASSAIVTILELDNVGVGFVSVTQPALSLGRDNPFRRTMLAAFAELAQMEREAIVVRIKAGIAAAKRRGVRLGQPPKATALVRGRIERLRRQGLSIRQIQREVGLGFGTVQAALRKLEAERGHPIRPDEGGVHKPVMRLLRCGEETLVGDE